eukprot:TRINITY_DN58748_c0_g1_i1.p1 TRINITY_DN58748_c0_g1~~TRINITY_DN58748_c0_g1_i1.p1  ORF type:complete len:225 (+),score=52.53 TRINITY_DN58748_c0_g1_i1:26-676(+)
MAMPESDELIGATSLASLRTGEGQAELGPTATPLPLFGGLLPSSASGGAAGASFQPPARGAASSPKEFSDFAENRDFATCCDLLMKELGITEEKELLPLLIGVLGEISQAELAEASGERKRGAFSKSVKGKEDQSAAASKVSDTDAFRLLRRLCFSSESAAIVRHFLAESGCQEMSLEDVPDFQSQLSRFGFPAGEPGCVEMKKALDAVPVASGES